MMKRVVTGPVVLDVDTKYKYTYRSIDVVADVEDRCTSWHNTNLSVFKNLVVGVLNRLGIVFNMSKPENGNGASERVIGYVATGGAQCDTVLHVTKVPIDVTDGTTSIVTNVVASAMISGGKLVALRFVDVNHVVVPVDEGYIVEDGKVSEWLRINQVPEVVESAVLATVVAELAPVNLS